MSGRLPEANTDAGTALDRHRNGRIQISEFDYLHRRGRRHALTLGLIDPSSYFDQRRIASDENTQFLGASFTGSPTIAFPDYTPGGVYERTGTRGVTVRAAIAGSNGLADNPDASCAQPLELDAPGKGLFATTFVA